MKTNGLLNELGDGPWTAEDTAWAWRRIASMVTSGYDLRPLRNRFGLAIQGKYQLTQEDVDCAMDAIYNGAPLLDGASGVI